MQLYVYYREFIDGNYVDLKKSNPKLPILIRECSGVRPVIFARYGALLYHAHTVCGLFTYMLPMFNMCTKSPYYECSIQMLYYYL